MSNTIFWFFSFLVLTSSSIEAERRIGKLSYLSWDSHFSLGANDHPYYPSESTPDLSTVGALLSRYGSVGSGTLVAPNAVVTAAHVVRNSFADEVVPADWQFLLGAKEDWSTSSRKVQVSKILIHPGWIARQSKYNRFGDGDELGVDIALIYLKDPIPGIFPARLPEADDDPLGERAVLAGYGTLVEGINGKMDDSNQRRVGGENIFDRSVPKIIMDGVQSDHLGGLLAIDFDSSSKFHNTLGEEMPSVDLLGSGQSAATPLPLEASTAKGDSGGPAFARTQQAWRVHGVVSYGTRNSRYGDITIYTRLASHYEWLSNNMPNLPSARAFGYGEWRESSWWGFFLPDQDHWNFHISFGWVKIPKQSDDSFWGWQSSLGWCWFSSQTYPYFYELKSHDWYYLNMNLSRPGKILRYNYNLEKWEIIYGS